MNGRKLVILDRDGVLNVDSGYPFEPSQIVWTEGAFAALRLLREAGFITVVATNQSGIARGFFSEQDVVNLHSWMSDKIKEKGGCIERFYLCPFHPEATIPEYRRDSFDRKPQPGMLMKAMSEYGATSYQTVMIGDRNTDMEAAAAAGIRGLLFDQSNLEMFIRKHLLASPRTPL